MVQALGIINKKAVFAATLLAVLGLPVISQQALAQQDPPSRVARLNHVEGNVSMEPAGLDDWAPAVVNHPFTLGDYLYTDSGARAELHMDEAVLRMGPQTSFGFLNLNDQVVQIKLSEGDMSFRLHDLGMNQTFEVDTPNAAVTLLRAGVYRFRVDPSGSMSFVVVRGGQAEITGGGQAFTLNPGNSALISGTDQLAFDVEAAPFPDDFDNWCTQRDAHEAQRASARYLPPTVIGYEDLDDYGAWQEAPDYGPVWYPRTVAAGWAPYQAGHWIWVEPWGWTWVDDAPWGFAPFHYGRWAYIGGRWGWAPGPIAVGYRGPVVRPYYAPALVAWFGGAHWGVSVSIGRPSVGWVPLGFGEVFTPSYACSRNYFTNVNVYNTRVVNTVNITNVYNTVYVNHTVYNREYVNVRAPGAVTAMHQDAFASGRPVREGSFAMRPADVGQLRSSGVLAPQVAPTRQSLAAGVGRPAARPSQQILTRQVVARNTPPQAPVAFAARQQFLTQHAGQTFNAEAMHQSIHQDAGARPVAAAFVRQAPPAKAVAVHVGEKVGNVAAARAQGAPQGQITERTQPAGHQQLAQPAGQPVGQSARQQPDGRPAITERTQTAPPQAVRSQAQPSQQTRPQPVFTERTQPAARPEASRPAPTERSRPVPTTAVEERRPVTERSQQPRPAARPEASRPALTERSQPVPTTAVEERRPVTERSQQPQPAARPAESRPAVAERSQSAPAPTAEHKPPAAAHEEHHSPDQHKDQHKDKDTSK